MQKSIGGFVGSIVVAAVVVMFGFKACAPDAETMGKGDGAVILTTAVTALLKADTLNPLPRFNDLTSSDDFRRTGRLYEQSALGLMEGATTFAALDHVPNPAVVEAGKAGARLFTAIAAIDREAAERLTRLADGLGSRDDNLGWFYDAERKRVELWNEMGAAVTKPLADAAIDTKNQLGVARLKLTKPQLQQVRLSFANAAAESGGMETNSGRLLNDLYWRLFGVDLFAQARPGKQF